MRFVVTLLFLAVISHRGTDAARWCMSGAGQTYHSKLCGTGGDHNVDCHQFRCEGGRSPFVLRTCGEVGKLGSGCEAGIATCNRAGGKGSCFTCGTDNCNGDPKAGTPTGDRRDGHGGHNRNSGGHDHNGGGSNRHDNGGHGYRGGGGSDRTHEGDRNNGGNRGSIVSKLLDILVRGSSN